MMRSTVVFISLFFLFSFNYVLSQDLPTTNKTNSQAKVKKSDRDDNEKDYMLIFKPNTRGILYGNPCVLEVTRKMGFEYSVAPKGTPGYRTELGRVFHNFGVKTVLFFKNPFWKIKVNRKIKECRYKTGDYTG